MKVVEQAIKFPVTTTVGVLLLVLFGTLALFRIPVQLTPTVERPQISVNTIWPGASPQEIEREIVDEQEEQLKSLEGLVEMESTSSDSQGSINLTFQVGSDNDANLLKVSNRLEQVPEYPPDADKPVISTTGANQQAIAWFVMIPDPESDEPFDGDISTLFNFVDDRVKPELERVPGVAQSNVFGGREREMHVIFSPSELAARGVTLNQLATALDRENRNFSGGDFPEGKRRYVVRTMGEYESPEEIEDVVIAVKDGTPVYVGDVAYAELGYRKPGAKTFFKGQPMIAVNAVKEPGANVLDAMEGLQAARDRIQRDVLAPRGLLLHQVYDETEYIESAIDLVQQSLMVGGVLAIFVLLLFLRSTTSTLVVAVAIPISVVGTFLMMAFFERTLNVISLAGLAFAVGMVVDNSIVVLENVYRHRQMGKPRGRAAYEGTKEVWGAVLASTLTTIAVFVPVVFIEEEAGQLFRDIAIAISCAVALSLIVAMTVIPSLSSKILGRVDLSEDSQKKKRWKNLWGWTSTAGRFRDGVANLVYRICGSTTKRLAVVLLFTTAALGLSWLLMPKAEYLPTGNQNFLFGIVQPPPGYNIDEVAKLEDLYVEELGHLWEGSDEETRDEPGGGILNHFFVALNNQAFLGARARDPLRAGELIPVFNEVGQKIPGAIAFISQASLFSQDIGEGRNIDVDLIGPELERLVALGGEIFGRVMQVVPGSQVRPIPSLDLGNPEVQVVPHRRRLAEMGISNRELGFVVSALVDGARASDYRFEGEEIDLDVQAEESFAHRTHLLEQMPIATSRGELVTLGSVGEVRVVDGPTSIQHRERQRSITIQVTPPEDVPLQQAMEDIEGDPADPRPGRPGGRVPGSPDGHGGQAHRDRRRLEVESGAGPDHHLSPDVGPVRELPLSLRHHVQRAVGGAGGLFGVGGAEPLHLPGVGHPDHAGLHHPDRHRGQQRDPGGAPVPEPHAGRGAGPPGGDPRGHGQPHPADLHERVHQRLRHVAPGALPRRGLRALPGPGQRGGGRADRLDGLHPDPDSGPVQPDAGLEASPGPPVPGRLGRDGLGGGRGGGGGVGGLDREEPDERRDERHWDLVPKLAPMGSRGANSLAEMAAILLPMYPNTPSHRVQRRNPGGISNNLTYARVALPATRPIYSRRSPTVAAR